jgi:hypothetical protein
MIVIAMVISFSGCGCYSEDEEKVTVNLSISSVEERTVTDGTCWDATLDVNKITPRGEKVIWREVRIIIKGADGNVLDPAINLELDEPSLYHEIITKPQFWYVDTDDNNRMDAGDQIKITGLDMRYEGALVYPIKAGEQIGSITLPSDFE